MDDGVVSGGVAFSRLCCAVCSRGVDSVWVQEHRSGVYKRVMEKLNIVEDIYINSVKYENVELDHPTDMALRELSLEKVRKEKFTNYPSRMAALYVSKTYEEAERWGEFFARIGRPTYYTIKVEVTVNCFEGDAYKCSDAAISEEENLEMAESVKEINANIGTS